jgi:hypothetical protein
MWSIDPLLGKDRETNEITNVARQQPAITWEPQQYSATMKGLLAVFAAWSMPRRYPEDNWGYRGTRFLHGKL